jgi:antirestriction protein
MEQEPNQTGGERASYDECVIREGIEAARAEQREIDDRTARLIAGQLHGGQTSALYSLTSSGAIDEARISQELAEEYARQTPRVREWIDWLSTYYLSRPDKGPVEGWVDRTEEQGRRDLLARIEAAAEDAGSEDRRLSGEAVAPAEPAEPAVPDPEEERRHVVGEVATPGSAGSSGETPADLAGDEDVEQQPRVQPRIWVACLASYNNGILYGRWVEADQEVEALAAEVQAMLAESPVPGAEEFAIYDDEGFFDLGLGEYQDLPTISRVARGIVEHGEAYALLAKFASLEDLEFLEAAMRDNYLGAWESMEAFAEHVVDDLGVEAYIEHAPVSYRKYLKVDLERLAEDLELELTVLDGGDGRVYVFDPRK